MILGRIRCEEAPQVVPAWQIKSIFPTILKYLISVSERGLGRGLDIEAVRSSGLVDLLKGEYSRARPLLLAKANVIQIQI